MSKPLLDKFSGTVGLITLASVSTDHLGCGVRGAQGGHPWDASEFSSCGGRLRRVVVCPYDWM
eukprot:11275626-Prorocentrum_lima.AAC.1